MSLDNSIREIWSDLIPGKEIGSDDNFFECGGDSLLGLRFIARMGADLGVRVSIRDLFLHPTSRQLAGCLQGAHVVAASAIRPAPARRAPLSFSQERLWTLDRLKGSVEYHIPWIFRVKGVPDAGALSRAFKALVARHAVLRSVIRHDGRALFQEALDGDSWSMRIIDRSEGADIPAIHSLIQELVGEPFDLSSEPPFRVWRILLRGEESILVIVLHHIAADAWSLSVIANELTALYSASALPPVDIQYADFAFWQRQQFSVLPGEQLDYWKRKLSGAVGAGLPPDFPRPLLPGIRGRILAFDIDAELTESLRALALQHGATLFMVLLAAFKAFFYRYTRHEDICVGTPVSGRTKPETERMVGFFVNMLALRSNVSGELPFSALLEQVKETMLDAYEHQDIPFDIIAGQELTRKDRMGNALFRIVLSFENTPDASVIRLGEVLLRPEPMQVPVCRYELAVSAAENGDGLRLNVGYALELYKEETITRMMNIYLDMLRAVVRQPDQRIGRIALGEGGGLALTSALAAGAAGYGGIITDLFEAQVRRTPDHVAVEFEEERLTYRELDERSGRLAGYLRGLGVVEDMPVPVCLERSSRMIIAILGILRAGGAYVPINPAYPAERIDRMIADCGGEIVVSESLMDEVPESQGLPRHSLRPGHLAYMIYTSGTTGRPKAVMIEHRSLVSLIQAQRAYFDIREDDRILQFSNYCFDASVEQIFLALCSGACLVLFREGLQLDGRRFGKFLEDRAITHLHATPGFLGSIPAVRYPGLRRVIAGGEACPKSLWEKWGPAVRFYNKYGPTETTVTAVEYACPLDGGDPDGHLPIGRCLPGVSAYILDEGGNLLPVGMPGELYLGGYQVARGYAGDGALTAEKFIADPFSAMPGARMYRTGDIVVRGSDGNLAWLGRKDNQVKIRGHRIEPEEVESILLSNGRIRQCAVIAIGERLAAYVVPAAPLDRGSLMEWMRARVPDFMLPAQWIEMERLPLTSNGKVDRRSLPAPDGDGALERPYLPPETALELQLTNIWQEILGAERIGVTDNFFELGGHSIFAMRLSFAIEQALGIELPGGILYQQPNIRLLAGAISGLGPTADSLQEGYSEIRL